MKRVAAMITVAALSALVLWGQDALPEWVRQIARIKREQKQNLAHIPNYVCRETIERTSKGARAAVFRKVDTLEFDVAHVGNKDLLARPGSSAFEDLEVSSFISSGMLGTGEFSASANNLFVADVGRFTPHPKSDAALPVPLGFDFEIPSLHASWQLSSGSARALVASRGTVWVDPETLELRRIEEHAMDIPAALGMGAVDVSVEYARMRIGSTSVLLPSTAETTVADLVGGQQRNLIQFSGCREFVSDSTIKFDTVAPDPVRKK